MSIVIDGITLPEFPEGEMEFQFETITTSDFPYRVMLGFGPVGEAYQFILVATKSPIIHIPEELIGIEAFMQMEAGYFISQCVFRLDGAYNDGPIWYPYEAHSDEQFGAGVGTTISSEVFKTIFWSNYDIKTAIAVNEDTMEVTTGDEIYFANCETPAEPEPEYGKIRRQYMRDIGDAIRRKTGKKDKIPTPLLASEIDSIVTADGLPVADDYAFGAIASNYGLNVEPEFFAKMSSYNKTYANKFKPRENFDVIGFRVTGVNNYDVGIKLWDADGNLLGKTTGVCQSQATWSEMYLDTKIPLNVDTEYWIGVYSYTEIWKGSIHEVVASDKITLTGWGTGSYNTFPTSVNGMNTSSGASEIAPVDIIIGVSSDLPETYQISLDTINGLAAAIQTATGSKSNMRIDEMISALQNAATATAEE